MITSKIDLDIINTIINQSGRIQGVNRETLKQMLVGSMFNDDKFLLSDIEDGKMRAFLFATVERLDGEDVVFIQACHSDKDGTVQTILDKLIFWAKDLGIKKLVFMTKRNPLAWQRKYKFCKTYSVMERSI